jgi:hypothetical protein
VNPSTSLNWAKINFKSPAIFLITLFWAAEPTRETDKPGETAGLIPLENKSVSKKIWPSVIEITLVGTYAETSPCIVSIIGKAVIEPPFFKFAERSNNLECKKNTSPG